MTIASGCLPVGKSASFGTSGRTAIGADEGAFAFEGAAALQVQGSRGVVLGVDAAAVAPRDGGAPLARGGVHGGYAYYPLFYERRVGVEALARVDYGGRAVREQTIFGRPPSTTTHGGWFGGVSFGVPIRLSPSSAPWIADDVRAPALYVVPYAEVVGVVPSPVRAEVGGGLAFRIHFWPTEEP